MIDMIDMIDPLTPRTRPISRAAGLLLACMLASACGADSPSTQEISAETPPKTGPEPGPAVPPEPAPNCDIVIQGERRVERALLDTSSRGLTTLTVVDGRKLEIDCPENPADRTGAALIAELQPAPGEVRGADNIVNWKVDLGQGGAGAAAVKLSDAEPGLPPDLNEDDLAQLRQQWGDIDLGAAVAKHAAPAEPEQPKPAEAEVKVEIDFDAGELKWIELMLVNQTSKRNKQLRLDPKNSIDLDPGHYDLSVRSPDTEYKWESAGELAVEADKAKLRVRLEPNPLRAKVVSSVARSK